jgi:hypothetical protein
MSAPKNPVPCLICGSVLDPAIPSAWCKGDPFIMNQPSAGVAFDSSGYYGSTLFDPMSEVRLEVAVCDACLEERWHRTRQVTRVEHVELLELVPPGLSFAEAERYQASPRRRQGHGVGTRLRRRKAKAGVR